MMLLHNNELFIAEYGVHLSKSVVYMRGGGVNDDTFDLVVSENW